MHDRPADWAHLGRYGGHAVVIDVIRTGASSLGTSVEVVAFDRGRCVTLASDTVPVLAPRLATAAEAALQARMPPVAAESSSAAPIHGPDGSLIGAVSATDELDERGLAVLGGLARLVEHHILSGALASIPAAPEFAQAVLDGLRDLVVVLNPDFEVMWCNAAIGDQLALTAADVVGRNIVELLHPDDVAPAIDAVIRLQSGFTTYRMILRVLHGRGEYTPMEVLALDRTMEPRVGGFVVTLRNDDRSREVERELDRTRSLAAAIVRDLSNAVIAADSTGGVRVINDAARALFGIDPDRSVAAITPEQLVLFDRHGRRIPLGRHPLSAGVVVTAEHLECMVINGVGVRHVSMSARRVRLADDEDLGVVVTFQDVTEAMAANAELKATALIDQLTGLPNRRFLERHLEELMAGTTPRRVGVCFIDLDGFKGINDVHGHRVGDHLLRIAGRRLQAALRDGDVVARHGGDEFVGLLLDVTDEAHAVEISERLRRVLCDPFEVDGTTCHVTASVGVIVDQLPGTSADLLLQHADIALYEAKGAGRNRVEVFDADLAASSEAEQRNRDMIRSALSTGDLVMHFQPVVDTEAGRMVGMEALVRCRTADGSIVGPGAFLDDLTGSNLLVELDRAAFGLSCLAAAQISAIDGDAWVACNFSAASLRQTDLVEFVVGTVEAFGVAPHNICIEVTESGAFEARRANLDALRSLREAGFGIALDDFGTGYSSLAHLRDLPLTVVKLDRSFVTKLHERTAERAIASAIVRLSSELGFRVVAEGVETAAQLDAVRELGFAVVQGWYFAPALPIEGALLWLGADSGALSSRTAAEAS